MPNAYINRIATSVPNNDMHGRFVEYAGLQLRDDARSARLFQRLSELGGIEHRFSFLSPSESTEGGALDAEGFYRIGAFPSTAERMRLFEKFAPILAKQAIDKLKLGDQVAAITHLIITCCTGMSAPGLDLQIVDLCGLPGHVERTNIGFMGCYAAINALKMARHVVRSEPDAKVLVVNLELCSLHFQESKNLEELLSFYLFADGCAASLITSDPVGLQMDSFRALLAPDTSELITWHVGDSGFDMQLSGQVPCAIREALGAGVSEVLRGAAVESIDLWAVHPGGRSILDAVQSSLDLPKEALADSREILRRYGNMSSPTVVFVLQRMLERATPKLSGCAMSFGPGLVAETMLFSTAA